MVWSEATHTVEVGVEEGKRVTPKSGLLLLVCCVAAIAAVGCVFELSSGAPDLGTPVTAGILALSIPATIGTFYAAVQDTRANQR
ncbi:hypothetical protein ACQ4M4_03740 [Leptolyngbya sp. AN02str]|uniref:hypothetical protein n=1 Tax=Leptolyngbya sp. AN02str TaxID=3423363 RepID=UPI003D32397A